MFHPALPAKLARMLLLSPVLCVSAVISSTTLKYCVWNPVVQVVNPFCTLPKKFYKESKLHGYGKIPIFFTNIFETGLYLSELLESGELF